MTVAVDKFTSAGRYLFWERSRLVPLVGINLPSELISAEVRMVSRSMLHPMQEHVANPSAESVRDFAGLLAQLTAAEPAELAPWRDEELEQDVAALSYESALRAHPHHKTAEALAGEQQANHSDGAGLKAERDRKCASVTIRMSKAECEQLRRRAAEAGLTVSGYVRSCTLEAEALRAEVKETLAELRRAHVQEANASREAAMTGVRAGESVRRLRSGWWRRIIPDLHPVRGIAQA